MEPELYAMLCLYSSHHKSLSMHDVAVILDVHISVIAEPITHLLGAGYLRIEDRSIATDAPLSFNAKLCITYAGKLAIQATKRSKRDRFWVDFRAWFTLAIAFIGLIVAIISLIWQQPLHY